MTDFLSFDDALAIGLDYDQFDWAEFDDRSDTPRSTAANFFLQFLSRAYKMRPTEVDGKIQAFIAEQRLIVIAEQDLMPADHP